MTDKTLYIVQQFERVGKKLVAGRALEFKNSIEAVARADRDAPRFAGVIALTQTIDTETGEVLEDPAILVRHGELPTEFQED